MSASAETTLRVKAVPRLPAADEPRGRFILRDGSVVEVRETGPQDSAAMAAFFHGLSPESRYQRFASVSAPGESIVKELCDNSCPADSLTLVAIRGSGGNSVIVGTGSYFRLSVDAAEVAFAVGDSFQARGIGTGLLERLAVEASRHGVQRFIATTERDNTAMLDVFARSGFRTSTTPSDESVSVSIDLSGLDKAVEIAEAHERDATVRSIAPFFRPRGIVVVGVSETSGGIGRRIYDAIRGSKYKDAVFAVNGKGGMRGGIPTHASVRRLPVPVDLAVIAVPHAAVPAVVDDCAAAGVKALVVISAGFSETGEEGRRRQDALVRQVRGYGMRMVGPNCMGLVNADSRSPVNASFSPVFPAAGHLSLASQSGALGIVVLALSAARHVGISSFVSLGNKGDVSGNDMLQYWEQDPETRVIGLYLESFGNPRRFARLARRVARKKPIIAVKAGRTKAGSRAAGSHTAALAAGDAAVDALFRQTGVIRAATIDELIDTASCLEAQPLPGGRRVAIVTNAGGPGILAADACEAAGLRLAAFCDATVDRLRAILPAAASVANPVDMVASAGADECAKVVAAVLDDPAVDALIVLHTGVNATVDQQTSLAGIRDGVLAARANQRHAPIVACVMGDRLTAPIDTGSERVPMYAFPENAVRALGHVASYAEWLRQPTGDIWTFADCQTSAITELVSKAASRRDEWLSPEDTRALMEQLGAPLVSTNVTRTIDQALEAAVTLGYPLVAKLHAKGLVHKTEAGGVITNIAGANALRTAFTTLEERARIHGLTFEGVILQPMIQGGVEAVVGVTRDAAMGALVGVGMGGTEVEVIGDVHFGLVPVTDRDVERLMARTRLNRLLTGFRGRPAADRRALAEVVLRLSQLAEAVPAIAEIDLNPVMVLPDGAGCVIVDARVRIDVSGSAGEGPFGKGPCGKDPFGGDPCGGEP